MSKTKRIQKSSIIYLFHSYETVEEIRERIAELTGDERYTKKKVKCRYYFGEDEVTEPVALLLKKYMPEDIYRDEFEIDNRVDWIAWGISIEDMLPSWDEIEKLSGYSVMTRDCYSTSVNINDVEDLQENQRITLKDGYGYDFKSYIRFTFNIEYILPEGDEWKVGSHKKVILEALSRLNNRIEDAKIMQMKAFASSTDCRTVTKEEFSCQEEDNLISQDGIKFDLAEAKEKAEEVEPIGDEDE